MGTKEEGGDLKGEAGVSESSRDETAGEVMGECCDVVRMLQITQRKIGITEKNWEDKNFTAGQHLLVLQGCRGFSHPGRQPAQTQLPAGSLHPSGL